MFRPVSFISTTGTSMGTPSLQKHLQKRHEKAARSRRNGRKDRLPFFVTGACLPPMIPLFRTRKTPVYDEGSYAVRNRLPALRTRKSVASGRSPFFHIRSILSRRKSFVIIPAVYLREKLSKKLGVSLPLDKAGAKKLRAQRQELTEQNESPRPKLGQIREELDQLSKLRYWTRKAIPEALPERDDFSEQMEVRENRRELEQVMDAAIDAVTQEADEQQLVTESPAQEKKRDQERQ